MAVHFVNPRMCLGTLAVAFGLHLRQVSPEGQVKSQEVRLPVSRLDPAHLRTATSGMLAGSGGSWL
jgi:hypothetical protein